MDFYESIIQNFWDEIRARAGFTKEESAALALELMKEASCQALQEIRDVLMDDTLDDPSCFHRIERIVEIYDALGPGGGGRHDFG